ncbi:hypothetical protein M427DRAFT_39909 [Gonapodya prolifera JEL478]|uniref:Uncharacterized protein n=1 Tax=Gonapodya prolifera (strain JEL478) TaxID=1344416 RepID=A0A138ZWJ9_GONPJ|nr:hypothetical protein M427DRAFT_39909 [Gonapodya prolifera JEL478]|eukprot:KXS08824.1 hypothetical protein M427DRAFT_39909 [Gonapodya prolifera JEL478]
MNVEPKEDNNARGASKSSKEETEATPKQKLTNPVAIPITHIFEPDSLEAALMAFASQQGATTSVVIIDFPSQDDADKQRLQINMAKFRAMKSDYQTASTPTSATIHFAFQSTPISKGDLPNDSTLFGATNNVAHYAVTLRSPAPLNWAKVLHNLVPDVDIVKYVTRSQSKRGKKKLPFFMQQVPLALWMELITLALYVILLVVVTAAHIAGVEGGEEESECSDTDEETPSDKDMIDDGDEGDQGAGKGGDDKTYIPAAPCHTSRPRSQASPPSAQRRD